jgi:hypothetical protein
MMLTRLALATIAVMGCVSCWAPDYSAAILAYESPLIEAVEYRRTTWIDSPLLVVSMVPEAQDSDARDVWCTVIAPSGLPESLEVWVVTSDEVEMPSSALFGIWDSPGDCSDPLDIPRLQAVTFQ